MQTTVTRKEKPISALPALTKVAAYARVSSAKDEMLHSLDAQVNYYSNYISVNPDWAFAGIYADEAMTGTKNNRPEFRRLIEGCRTGMIDMVVTKSISRFARNTVDLLMTVRELKKLGVAVYFEEQNINTLSGDGELLLTILASYAQEESLSVSENCKWRIRMRFENGELANLRFMYGYRITKGRVEVDTDQAAVVQDIFRDYIGGMGGGRIASKLREMKVPTERGGTWDGERVMKIIRNEKYTGNALLQKRYITDHLTKRQAVNNGVLPKYYATETHPSIISQETFDQAQAVLQERLESCGNKSRKCSTYPFSGVISCGNCGKHFKRITARGQAAWNCTTFLRDGKNACQARMIPEEQLMAITSEVLGQNEFDSGIFRNKVSKITAHDGNGLSYVFCDGHTEERTWQQRSRRDSWTDEMKQAARERANRRWNNGDKR